MSKDKSQLIEQSLDLSTITIRHGVHSFRYGTSSFLAPIFHFLNLSPTDVFYDLGSGYGVILRYAAQLYPDTQFFGIEILKERFDYCQELQQEEALPNLHFYNDDLLKFDFSDGTVFYIFNPLFSSMYEQLLNQLKQIALKKELIIVAESKCDCFDQTNWLHLYHSIQDSIDVRQKVCFYRSTLH